MSATLPDVLTIQETSEYLRIPLRRMYTLAQEGKVPCQKIGKHWRFRRETLDKWVDGKSITGFEKQPQQNKNSS